MASTEVYDLRKPGLKRVISYDLPPKEAVRNAYAQLGKGDYNTWEYAKYNDLVQEHVFSVSCGGFFAFKEVKSESVADIPSAAS